MIVKEKQVLQENENKNNACSICNGIGQVKYRSSSPKVVPCPICYGTGKLVLNKKEIKAVANNITAQLLFDALSVGFHLNKINDKNHDNLFVELNKIYGELFKKGRLV